MYRRSYGSKITSVFSAIIKFLLCIDDTKVCPLFCSNKVSAQWLENHPKNLILLTFSISKSLVFKRLLACFIECLEVVH